MEKKKRGLRKWLSNRCRDRRGTEIKHLVPDMLAYVKEHLEPIIQYCIDSSDPLGSSDSSRIRYSLPDDELKALSVAPAPKIKPVIADMKAFRQEAEKDMSLYDSQALQNTYHAWEKENSAYKSFSSEVVRMVKERYAKTSEFYKAAGIDKRTYHKISTDFGYKPSRMTAFRCCIGLRLTVEEAEDLLKLAGMAFSPNDPNDLVLKFCLEKGIQDIPGINYMLYMYANRPLDDKC